MRNSLNRRNNKYHSQNTETQRQRQQQQQQLRRKLCKQKCRATITATAGEAAITIKSNFKRHDTFWLNIRQEQ